MIMEETKTEPTSTEVEASETKAVEEWLEAMAPNAKQGSPEAVAFAMKVAAARAFHKWPIGLQLTEGEFLEQLDAATSVQLGGLPRETIRQGEARRARELVELEAKKKAETEELARAEDAKRVAEERAKLEAEAARLADEAKKLEPAPELGKVEASPTPAPTTETAAPTDSASVSSSRRTRAGKE